MADKQQEQRSNDPATAPHGVDVNEAMVASHPGFERASDQPNPNPYAAGQTPAGETNQPTFVGVSGLQRALGDAESALSANLVYENGVPSTRAEHIDPVIEKLEDALKALKDARKSS